LETQKYPTPILCHNADGSLNKSGNIMDYIKMNMEIRDHMEQISFAVTNLGKTDVFLGYEWLQHHNPSINWKTS